MLTHSLGVADGKACLTEGVTPTGIITNSNNPTRGRPPLHSNRQMVVDKPHDEQDDKHVQKKDCSENEDNDEEEEEVDEEMDELTDEDVEIDVDGLEGQEELDEEEEEEEVEDITMDEDEPEQEAKVKTDCNAQNNLKRTSTKNGTTKADDDDEIDIEN